MQVTAELHDGKAQMIGSSSVTPTLSTASLRAMRPASENANSERVNGHRARLYLPRMARIIVLLLLLAPSVTAGKADELVQEFLALGRQPDRGDYDRRTSILFALRDLKNQAGHEALLKLVPRMKRPTEFLLTTVFLGRIRDVRHMQTLMAYAAKKREEPAIRGIGQMVLTPSAELKAWILQKGLNSTSAVVAGASCRAAGTARIGETVEALRRLRDASATSPDRRRTAFEAGRALGLMGGIWPDELATAARHESYFLRLAAAELVPSIKAQDEHWITITKELLKDPDRRVRKATLDSIITWKRAESAGPCIEALEHDPVMSNRAAAQRALKAISGRDFSFDAATWRSWLKDQKTTGKANKKYSFARYYGHAITGEDICFVVDMSGSMRGERIRVARKELFRALDALPPATRFNVVLFASKVLIYKPKRCIAATPKRIKRAKAWVSKNFQASGQTHTWGALQKAFALKRLDTIFLLSDGTPSMGDYENVSDTIEAIYAANWERRITIHTIALSLAEFLRKKQGGWGENFMQRIAKATGGDCRIMTNPPR